MIEAGKICSAKWQKGRSAQKILQKPSCKTHAQFKCSDCERAYYCSWKCQVADWRIHKKNCKVWRAKLHAAQAMHTARLAQSVQSKQKEPDVQTSEECPICLDRMIDPISPCKDSSHKVCRQCAVGMRQKGKNNLCALCRGYCRGDLTSADELFEETAVLLVRAGRKGEANQVPRNCSAFRKLLQAGRSGS